jgi:hypothetical protein
MKVRFSNMKYSPLELPERTSAPTSLGKQPLRVARRQFHIVRLESEIVQNREWGSLLQLE